MNISMLAFIFGCILILIGIIGGGLELKELKIPKVSSFSRVIAIIGGIVFISMGIEFPVFKPDIPSPTLLSDPTNKPEVPLMNNKDSYYKKAIIGTWKYHESMPEGGTIDGTTTYAPNGQVSSVGTISFQNQDFHGVVSGIWSINEGYLYSTVKSSNFPTLMPVGLSSSDKIISIANNEFRYISDGETSVEYRVR